MKLVKKLKGWGIFENTLGEICEHGFRYTVLHPDNMECRYICTPRDSDIECDTLENAVSWIQNY